MFLVLLLLAQQVAERVELVCGTERWQVKTMSDSMACLVNLVDVVPITIDEVNRQPARCSGLPEERTYPQEFAVFKLHGTITLKKKEKDQDIHIILARSNRTVIVEVPDPDCAPDSIVHDRLVLARKGAEKLRKGDRVLVEGIGFYDFAHQQTGMSRSCLEIHPVTRLRLLKRPGESR